MSRSLQGTFDKTLLRLAGETGGRFLLGVSGGIDSMCMAELFKGSSLHPGFAIAHVNFSLRGEDSDGDETFVRDWAASNGVEFFTTRFDTRAYAEEKGITRLFLSLSHEAGLAIAICLAEGPGTA